MNRTTGLVAAAFGVGAVVGFASATLVARPRPAPARVAAASPKLPPSPAAAPSPDPAAFTPVRKPAAKPVAAPAGVPSDPLPAASPGIEAKSPAAAAAVRAVLAVIDPIEPPKRGAGRITGAVRTAEGQPLPGLRVQGYSQGKKQGGYRPQRQARPTEPPAPPSVEDLFAEFLRSHQQGEAQRREATTGADGSYALEGLVEDEMYWVSVPYPPENDDLIIAIDGSEHRGPERLYAAYAEAMARPRATLTVLRRGAALTIVVGGPAFAEAGRNQIGGDVEAVLRPR